MRLGYRLRLIVDGLAIVPALAGVVYVLWFGFWPTLQLIDGNGGAFRVALAWALCFALMVDGWVQSGRMLDDVAGPSIWRGQ